MDLSVWACPVCHSSLAEEGDGFRCQVERQTFERRDGFPVLVGQEDKALLEAAKGYASAWTRLGLLPPPDLLSELPYLRSGRHNKIWAPKARSFELLLEILGPANGRKVADLGAGTGWLSSRLAEVGFRCYAIDLSADPRVGLAASRTSSVTEHRFEGAIAAMGRLPFLDESVDVAICNASLHYLADVRPTLAEVRRVLKPSGTFITMNEPVHRRGKSALRAANDFRRRLLALGGRGRMVVDYRHFVDAELEHDLRDSFGGVIRHSPDYGPWFRVSRRLKGLILGMELASFPILEARKPEGMPLLADSKHNRADDRLRAR